MNDLSSGLRKMLYGAKPNPVKSAVYLRSWEDQMYRHRVMSGKGRFESGRSYALYGRIESLCAELAGNLEEGKVVSLEDISKLESACKEHEESEREDDKYYAKAKREWSDYCSEKAEYDRQFIDKQG